MEKIFSANLRAQFDSNNFEILRTISRSDENKEQLLLVIGGGEPSGVMFDCNEWSFGMIGDASAMDDRAVLTQFAKQAMANAPRALPMSAAARINNFCTEALVKLNRIESDVQRITGSNNDAAQS